MLNIWWFWLIWPCRRFADTPRQITQIQDEEDSDSSKDSDKELTPPTEEQDTTPANEIIALA